MYRADELLELVERLLAQVVAVHQEEDALGLGELDEPVAEVDGGERLAAAGRHLDQRTGPVGGERRFEVLDALDLHPPQMAGVQRRHFPQMRPHLLVELGEADQFFGPVDAARPVFTGATNRITGNSATATYENILGEPNHGGGRKKSLWAAWTAPGSGDVIIDTIGSSFDTVLAVYVGDTLNQLRAVAQNNNLSGTVGLSRVKFPTKSGETYSVVVDGASSTSSGQGNVVVNIQFTELAQPPSEVGTDSFAARPTLEGDIHAMGVCNMRLYTREEQLFEPRSVGDLGTAWWRWVAPSNGVVTMDTFASSFDTVLTVYVGEVLTNLTELAINDTGASNVDQSRVQFQTKAGQAYQIKVDGGTTVISQGVGNVVLNIVLEPNNLPGSVPEAIASSTAASLRALSQTAS